MKKRIGIVFSGQMRTNGLNPNYNYYNNDNRVLDSVFKPLKN